MSETFVAVLHANSIHNARTYPTFGQKLHEAARELRGRPADPQPFTTYTSYAATVSWIVGKDVSEAKQVYVVTEHAGRRIYADFAARQSDLDALVDVLRGHGYTCRRTSGDRA
ncbi:hypothetical protein [Tianweitania sp.]|uniref:hypothetical protein n=1 Tax=Tianweitania sp. TaxID=2021634 RepID=UPI00289724EC|nr:hypothetical protein [Tianweitania sp.]